MAKEKVSLTIDRALWKSFRKYCDENAFSLSGKVELLIKHELSRSKRKEVSYSKVVSLLNTIVSAKPKKPKKKIKQKAKHKPKDKSASLDFLRDRMIEKKLSYLKK